MELMHSSLSLKMELDKRLYLSSSVIKLCINALTAQMLIDKQTGIFISSNNLIFQTIEK
jgi:hypothetical protein